VPPRSARGHTSFFGHWKKPAVEFRHYRNREYHI
jgi:hypothetical protein